MKFQKFMVVSDLHGDQMDESAVKSALAFAADFKPDIRVIAGDLWDFAAIRKGASADEQAESMASDFEAGKGFAEAYFSAKATNHLMLGNHDVRIWDLMEARDAVRADLGERMVSDVVAMTRKLKAKLWPYDAREGVLELGKLNVVHGFHTGMAACATHARIYGNVLFGHTHSVESFQVPGLQQKEAHAIGCLCRLNPDYANRKTGKLRWGHAFAFGYLFEDGTYNLHKARRIDGKFYASTEIKAY